MPFVRPSGSRGADLPHSADEKSSVMVRVTQDYSGQLNHGQPNDWVRRLLSGRWNSAAQGAPPRRGLRTTNGDRTAQDLTEGDGRCTRPEREHGECAVATCVQETRRARLDPRRALASSCTPVAAPRRLGPIVDALAEARRPLPQNAWLPSPQTLPGLCVAPVRHVSRAMGGGPNLPHNQPRSDPHHAGETPRLRKSGGDGDESEE